MLWRCRNALAKHSWNYSLWWSAVKLHASLPLGQHQLWKWVQYQLSHFLLVLLLIILRLKVFYRSNFSQLNRPFSPKPLLFSFFLQSFRSFFTAFICQLSGENLTFSSLLLTAESRARIPSVLRFGFEMQRTAVRLFRWFIDEDKRWWMQRADSLKHTSGKSKRPKCYRAPRKTVDKSMKERF